MTKPSLFDEQSKSVFITKSLSKISCFESVISLIVFIPSLMDDSEIAVSSVFVSSVRNERFSPPPALCRLVFWFCSLRRATV